MTTKKILIALLAITHLSCYSAVAKNLLFENTTPYVVIIENSSGKQATINPSDEITTNIFEIGDEIICYIPYEDVLSNTVKVQVFSKQFCIRGDADTNALIISPVSQTKKALSKTKAKIITWYAKTKERVKNRLQGEGSQE